MSDRKSYEIWLVDNHPDAVENNEFLATREPPYEFSNDPYDIAELFSKEEAEKIRKEILDDLDEEDKKYINIEFHDITPFKYKKNVKIESTNKYIQAFRESCRKLEEKQNFSNLYWNDIPPEKFTDKEQNAISEFDELLDQLNNGLITKKEFLIKCESMHLIDRLPEFDWTRNSDAKLPNELFPESYKKLEEDTYSFNKFRSQRNPLAQTKQEKNTIFNELKKDFNQYGINNYNFIKSIVNHPNEIELERNINLNDANIGNWTASNFKVLARNNLSNLKDLNLMDNFYKLKKILYPNDSDYIAMIKILYKFNQVDGFNKKI